MPAKRLGHDVHMPLTLAIGGHVSDAVLGSPARPLKDY
jgi:hypothetical protein